MGIPCWEGLAWRGPKRRWQRWQGKALDRFAGPQSARSLPAALLRSRCRAHGRRAAQREAPTFFTARRNAWR
jgi:hypothetical protein